MSNWQKIDKVHSLYFINETDLCFFAREYQVRKGYSAGETNQLISNFKKKGTARGKPEWAYRDRAVTKFASEICELIPIDADITLSAIPSSTAKTDPEYSHRFEDLLACCQRMRPKARIEWPIEAIQTVVPAHLNGTRKSAEIMTNYRWNGFRGPTPGAVWLIDDVITTGSHYKAYVEFARRNGFAGDIYGIFWARSVHPNPFEEDPLVPPGHT